MFSGSSASSAASGSLNRNKKPFGADVRLPKETVCRILHCLVEGNSVRGTARLCDVEPRTVLNVLTLACETCELLSEERVRNVQVKDLELNAVWTFVGCKENRLTPERFEKGMRGDAHTFIGLERTSKLVVAWHLGRRDRVNTEDFVSKIRWAGGEALLEQYPAGSRELQACQARIRGQGCSQRQSRSRSRQHVACRAQKRNAAPVAQTAHAANVCVLEKVGQSESAARAAFRAHNLCRIHGSLRITPAMAAGIADHVWKLEELIAF